MAVPQYWLDQVKHKGVWGQFDPFRVGDASRWEAHGGTKDMYQSLTAEQFAEWQWLNHGDPNKGGYHPLVQQIDANKGLSYEQKWNAKEALRKKWLADLAAGSTTPGVTATPEEKATLPTLRDPDLKRRRAAEMTRLLSGAGRASTFLTGPSGVTTAAPLARKTLLGA